MALILNGIDQYGILPKQRSDANSYLNNAVACSMAVWYKPSTHVGIANIAGACNNQNGYSNRSGFYRDGATGNVGWDNNGTLATVTTAVINEWHLLVISRPASSSPITSQVSTNTTDYTPLVNMGPNYSCRDFMVGGRYNNQVPGNFFTGKIGSFAVWKGRELSAADIDTLQAGAAFNTLSMDLTEYVDFVGSGTATVLTSSSGKALTFTGTPTLDADSPFAVASIDTVNGGTNTVTLGTATPITISGFGGNLTSGTVDGDALTAVSNTSITTSALVDNTVVPRFGSRVLALTDGTGLAEINVTVTPPTGLSYVTLSSGFLTGNTSVVKDFSPVPSVGDYIVFNPTTITVLANAGFESNYDGTQQLWHISGTSGLALSYDVITSTVIEMNLLSLIANVSSPIFDYQYPAGDRP